MINNEYKKPQPSTGYEPGQHTGQRHCDAQHYYKVFSHRQGKTHWRKKKKAVRWIESNQSHWGLETYETGGKSSLRDQRTQSPQNHKAPKGLAVWIKSPRVSTQFDQIDMGRGNYWGQQTKHKPALSLSSESSHRYFTLPHTLRKPNP